MFESLPAGRPILDEGIAYGHEKMAVIRDDHKLLTSPLDGYERVFRLSPSDRTEKAAEDNAGLAAALHAEVPTDSGEGGRQVTETSEIAQHLSALGYFEE